MHSITTATFSKPTNPKRCSVRGYHVWRWFGGSEPPPGTLCECGLIEQPGSG